jgi:hypothetical protein
MDCTAITAGEIAHGIDPGLIGRQKNMEPVAADAFPRVPFTANATDTLNKRANPK